MLKGNIISPANPGNELNWTVRKGPWGKTIRNLLLPPEAGDFVTPNKNTFVGQWYWDTMGTNAGLLRSQDNKLQNIAESMVKNLFLLYDKTGIIPNAADSVQTTRSQPPFLSSMCLDIGEFIFGEKGNPEKKDWYQLAYEYCKKEVLFVWEQNDSKYGFQWFDNITKTCPGDSPAETYSFFRPESRSDYRILRSLIYKILSKDIEELKNKEYKGIKETILKALSLVTPKQRKELKKWLYTRRLLVASGMDFTASYGLKPIPNQLADILEPGILLKSDRVFSSIDEISPVDLNCLIYKYYDDLIHMAELLQQSTDMNDKAFYRKEIQEWEIKKSNLRDLIWSAHLSKEDNLFYNYSIKEKKLLKGQTHLTHFAYPLYAGLADEKTTRGLVQGIRDLTTRYGVKLTQHKSGFQWDFNMWPLQVWITFKGLLRYGYESEAEKVAEGYIQCVEKTFREYGTFYEKYNAEEGNINTDGRYPAEPDFSWGAGIYLGLVEELYN